MSRSTSNSFGGGASVSADQFVDADESDFETPSQASSGADSDEENTGRRDRVFKAKDMAAIGEREEMAPITLLRDPKEVRESKERKRERSERIIKGEGTFIIPHHPFCFSPPRSRADVLRNDS